MPEGIPDMALMSTRKDAFLINRFSGSREHRRLACHCALDDEARPGQLHHLDRLGGREQRLVDNVPIASGPRCSRSDRLPARLA
jgi:hypothetical protein